jgi:hypothetical protein
MTASMVHVTKLTPPGSESTPTCSLPTFWFSKMARISCWFSSKYFWMSSVVITFSGAAAAAGVVLAAAVLGACEVGGRGGHRVRVAR